MGRASGWRRLGLLAALGAATGCATAPTPRLTVPTEAAPFWAKKKEAPAAAEASPGISRSSRCGAPIPGWAAFTRPGRVVVLGEIAGSREIPTFVGDAACQAAEAGHEVQIAVEIPRVEQHLIEEYLASDGGTAARENLLAGGMWHRMYEDGRSSRAVFGLIDRVRALRHEGLAITVHYFDELGHPGNAKEEQLARNIEAIVAKAPRGLHLVLTGNVHARTVVGVPWDPKFTPMGFHLLAALTDVVTLDAHYDGGEAWICRFSRWGLRIKCGASTVAAPLRAIRPEDLPRDKEKRPMPRFAGMWSQPSPEGYHGIFYVGTLSPAAPEVEPGVASR